MFAKLLICVLAPLTKDVGLNYETVAFNGSLLKENVYRQSAGSEVDAAWAALGVDCEWYPAQRRSYR